MSDHHDPPDTEAITEEFPAVVDPPRDGSVVWIVLGGLVGILAVIFFAGGLRDPQSASPATTTPTATVTTRTTTSDTTTTTGGAPRTNPARKPSTDTLDVAAVDPQGVYVEVRRRDAAGAVLFAGTLAQGTHKRFTIPTATPLWLSLAWAPSARVAVNGSVQPTAGATEQYLVTPTGLERRSASTRTGTTSR